MKIQPLEHPLACDDVGEEDLSRQSGAVVEPICGQGHRVRSWALVGTYRAPALGPVSRTLAQLLDRGVDSRPQFWAAHWRCNKQSKKSTFAFGSVFAKIRERFLFTPCVTSWQEK
jgi:hypothetical protein